MREADGKHGAKHTPPVELQRPEDAGRRGGIGRVVVRLDRERRRPRAEPTRLRAAVDVIGALMRLMNDRSDEPELCALYRQALCTALDPSQRLVELVDVATLAQLGSDHARLLVALRPHEHATAGLVVTQERAHLELVCDVPLEPTRRDRCAALFAVPKHTRLAHPERTASHIADLVRLGIVRVRRSSWDRVDALLRSAELDAWLVAAGEPLGSTAFVPIVLEATAFGADLLRASIPAVDRETGENEGTFIRVPLRIVEG